MGPRGAGQGAPRSTHPSSPAPGLRRPTRHLSPALPAHTPRTPAAPGALPPPTLRLPPLPEGADARASPAGAAPASQSVSARRGSGLGARGISGPWHPGVAGFLTFDLHLLALDSPMVGSARFPPPHSLQLPCLFQNLKRSRSSHVCSPKAPNSVPGAQPVLNHSPNPTGLAHSR